MAAGEGTARGLGYFSIGLGLAQVVAPGSVARVVGVQPGLVSGATMRLLGLREITAGWGIVSQRRPAQWVWARAAGDLMDLALTTCALVPSSNKRVRVAAALVAVAGITALDVQTAEQLMGQPSERGSRLVSGITVNAPMDSVEQFWKEFSSTAQSSELLQYARFRPAPGDRGTEIRIDAPYPKPSILAGLELLRGRDVRGQLQSDLRRAKQMIEAHDVVTAGSKA